MKLVIVLTFFVYIFFLVGFFNVRINSSIFVIESSVIQRLVALSVGVSLNIIGSKTLVNVSIHS